MVESSRRGRGVGFEVFVGQRRVPKGEVGEDALELPLGMFDAAIVLGNGTGAVVRSWQ